MIQYPQQYEVESVSPPGIQTLWSTHAEKAPIGELACAIPPEFQGPGGGLSPEDLYAMALANCFVATFKVFSEKSGVSYEKLEVRGSLTVDRDEKGVPWMAKFHLHATLTGASDPSRARTLLDKTSRSCLILNSVRTEKTFQFDVS